MENLIQAARQVEFALHFSDGHERAYASLELDRARDTLLDALAAAARQGGDVQQAPGEAPQSGPKGNAPEQSA